MGTNSTTSENHQALISNTERVSALSAYPCNMACAFHWCATWIIICTGYPIICLDLASLSDNHPYVLPGIVLYSPPQSAPLTTHPRKLVHWHVSPITVILCSVQLILGISLQNATWPFDWCGWGDFVEQSALFLVIVELNVSQIFQRHCDFVAQAAPTMREPVVWIQCLQ